MIGSTLDTPSLAIEDLHVTYQGARPVPAVRGVSLTVHTGETVALLGESGCGKTATARAVMGLLEPGTEVTGRIGYRDENLLDLPTARRRSLAGSEIAMVFQDAQSALNPAYSVGAQIAETFQVHQGTRKREALSRAVELIERVGIPEPAHRARQYPHQLSGGMRQRIIIAMAVALGPNVLLADEPTTALDVTVQAQIIALLKDLQREYRTALLLITHDLAVAAQIATRGVVMYAGQVVETGPLQRLYQRPRHPYTIALLQSVPRVDRRVEELGSIPGSPPDPAALPEGCPFAVRCPFADDLCRAEVPELRVLADETLAACHHAEVVAGE
ncbi:ABC transporter ATP-binding protein [Actinocrispum wychmicini]|uniref:Peptide/nickel transport system ATP-binding protein/oligopeptide transport system ATP-binding protein n=1 Tax=Actinocrispum wychmicini TaxID=1213861 RepID=A0A4R2ISE9_9PSEU|nr:ABC transporter ATP-binding protein [Actinocrispum wychmicini]TCO47396.1 peptide/nickel transport system ATP-binding protein/oligopeptide transport system ATP-binding protein [Actinocrispum wychmicini]